ncbi:MAG: F0F1 ATP synthase subunit B [Eubacteriales bacterium]
MEEHLELISLNIWHIVAAILNLLILTVIVKKFLFERVQKVLAERKSQVDTLYTDAETAKTAAESERAEYEEKLGQAQAEADELLRAAAQRADRMSDEILAAASEKASEKMRRADADIAQEKKKAINEIKNEISGMSVDIAEKVVGREIKEEDHKKLIDSFIEAL